jgi:ABC-type transporter lipoprotein component MlaA
MENPAFNEDLRQLKAMVQNLQGAVLSYNKQLHAIGHLAYQANETAKALKKKYEKEKKARDKYILKLQGKIKTFKTLIADGSHS